jgi:hypothetical protein
MNNYVSDSKKLDMWGLGIILYRLVNEGKFPFKEIKGMAQYERYKEIIKNPP